MILAIISHTEHFINSEGRLVGWGATVREINHLAVLFDKVIHVACFYNGPAPAGMLPYDSPKIEFVPLKPSGGIGLSGKLDVLLKMPHNKRVIKKVLNQCDVFQFRAPTGMGVYMIPYLFHCGKKGWFKYATNWVDKHPALSNRIQRKLLNNQESFFVTINGHWPNQKPHLLSFENPCLTNEEIEAGALSVKSKDFTGKFNLVFIGRLEDAKGVHRILHVLSKIDSERVGQVHLIGDGPKRKEYEEYVNNNCKQNIVFHGFLQRNEIDKILSVSHVFLLPSDTEGFPKVVAESTNYGLIPIVSEVSCIGQYVIEGETGFLVEPLDENMLYEKIINALNMNAFQLQIMSEKCHLLAEKFSYSRYIKSMNNTFSQNPTKPMIPVSWLVFHVALGVAVAQSSLVATLWCVSILVYGFYRIIRTKNKNDEAIIWAAYIAGADVVLRACGGAIIWEIGKLGVVVFLLLGLIVEARKRRLFPTVVVIMFLLLIPGVIITFTWSNRIREDITFNLSGMVCLLISMSYFYNRVVRYESFKKMIAYSLFPIIVLCVVLFFRTPVISEIDFTAQANDVMSGGYAPNQVSTILGYGWLVLIIMFIMREQVTFNRFLTLFVVAFVVYRSLFTFSRGGNLGAILGLVSYLIIYGTSKQKRVPMSKTIWMLLLFAIVGIAIVSSINTATNGVFGYRMTGRDTYGEIVEDVTTGRSTILEEELELFKDNLLGVGVGGSTHYRLQIYHTFYASHNEFGRLLSEHGIFGLIIIVLLLASPLFYFSKRPNGENKAYCMMFFVLSLASLMHSGCRTAMPEFVYGLSFLYLLPTNKE